MGTAPSAEDKEWICEQNITLFRSQLAAARDELQHRILSELLAQEEATLKSLASTQAADDQSGGLKPHGA